MQQPSEQAPIRTASQADLTAILRWLRQECRSGTGFWCNRSCIQTGYKKGQLQVLAHPMSGEPVAFCLGDLDILEVREELRGRGYGRRLAEHCIGQIRERQDFGVRIQCSPATSVPFWQKLGFRVLPHGAWDQVCAVRLFPHRTNLAAESKIVQVRIELWSEYPEIPISEPFVTRAAQVTPAQYQFEDRFVEHFESGDAIVATYVDGELQWREKLKYSEEVGFVRKGFFAALDLLDLGVAERASAADQP